MYSNKFSKKESFKCYFERFYYHNFFCSKEFYKIKDGFRTRLSGADLTRIRIENWTIHKIRVRVDIDRVVKE